METTSLAICSFRASCSLRKAVVSFSLKFPFSSLATASSAICKPKAFFLHMAEANCVSCPVEGLNLMAILPLAYHMVLYWDTPLPKTLLMGLFNGPAGFLTATAFIEDAGFICKGNADDAGLFFTDVWGSDFTLVSKSTTTSGLQGFCLGVCTICLWVCTVCLVAGTICLGVCMTVGCLSLIFWSSACWSVAGESSGVAFFSFIIRIVCSLFQGLSGLGREENPYLHVWSKDWKVGEGQDFALKDAHGGLACEVQTLRWRQETPKPLFEDPLQGPPTHRIPNPPPSNKERNSKKLKIFVNPWE